jgi:hypothetical protein
MEAVPEPVDKNVQSLLSYIITLLKLCIYPPKIQIRTENMKTNIIFSSWFRDIIEPSFAPKRQRSYEHDMFKR